MAHYDLKTEELKQMASKLRAGDTVSLTGTVYTARDAAHKKSSRLWMREKRSRLR